MLYQISLVSYCLLESYMDTYLFIVVAWKGHCLPTNYETIDITLQLYQSFMHVRFTFTWLHNALFRCMGQSCFCGFQEYKVCTRNFSTHHWTLSPYQVTCTGVLQLVRFVSSTRGWRRWTIQKMGIIYLTPFLFSKSSHTLTRHSSWWYASNNVNRSPTYC